MMIMGNLGEKHERVLRAGAGGRIRVVDSLVVLEPNHLVLMIILILTGRGWNLGEGVATVRLANHLHSRSHPEVSLKSSSQTSLSSS